VDGASEMWSGHTVVWAINEGPRRRTKHARSRPSRPVSHPADDESCTDTHHDHSADKLREYLPEDSRFHQTHCDLEQHNNSDSSYQLAICLSAGKLLTVRAGGASSSCIFICHEALGDGNHRERFPHDRKHSRSNIESGVEDLEAGYLEEGEETGENQGC